MSYILSVLTEVEAETDFPTKLKKVCKKHELDPGEYCLSIAQHVEHAHPGKYHFYGVHDKEDTEQHKNLLYHVYMHDPKTNQFFDGSGEHTQKHLDKEWKGDNTISRVDPRKHEQLLGGKHVHINKAMIRDLRD